MTWAHDPSYPFSTMVSAMDMSRYKIFDPNNITFFNTNIDTHYDNRMYTIAKSMVLPIYPWILCE